MAEGGGGLGLFLTHIHYVHLLHRHLNLNGQLLQKLAPETIRFQGQVAKHHHTYLTDKSILLVNNFLLH